MATVTRAAVEAEVERLDVSVYTVPMDELESDGTLEWSAVTLILVEVEAAGATGLGYTYGDESVATMVRSKLAGQVQGADALWPEAALASMQRAIRNAGRPGVGAVAISAVDVALWDLKARLLGVCLADALPRFHESVICRGRNIPFSGHCAPAISGQVCCALDAPHSA